MSLQDPIGDMLTRIRNGQMAKKDEVSCSSSNLKVAIAKVLEDEGYISGYAVSEDKKGITDLRIKLKYYQERPVIERLKRISRPSLRVYKACSDIQPIPGFGIQIISTSKGVMSHLKAKNMGLGGEVLCEVA